MRWMSREWELDRFITNFDKALKKSQRAAMMNGGIADVTSAAVAEDGIAPVNCVAALVNNDDVVIAIGAPGFVLCLSWWMNELGSHAIMFLLYCLRESENPMKSATMAEMLMSM